jgi:hypothetical protein
VARDEFDSYPTPAPVAQAVAQAIKDLVPDPSLLVEPSAGSGAFVRAARALWPSTPLAAIELDGRHHHALQSAGASWNFHCRWEDWVVQQQFPANTLVVGNPPFSLATEHVGLALDYLPVGSHIAFLLKMNFLCSQERARSFWPRRQLRKLRPFNRRPSFKKVTRVVDGKTKKSSNDTNEYALFVWQVGYDGPPEIVFPHISWENAR